MEDNNAYRAELTGILGAVSLVEAICKWKNVTAGSVTIGCDGLSTLNLSLHPSWDVRMSDKHHDILQCIFESRSRLPSGVILQKRWVKGHADNSLPYERMTRTQQLNVDCDHGARALASMPNPPDRPLEVSGDAWAVKIQGTRLVNDIDTSLRKWIHDPAAVSYTHLTLPTIYSV